MKDNQKNSIERAVNKASQALLAIVKEYEEHGDVITDEFSRKMWVHLQKVLGLANTRALVALSIKRHGVGSFSLDAPAEQVHEILVQMPNSPPLVLAYEGDPIVGVGTPVIPPATPTIVPETLVASSEQRKWVKPTGRIAGSKELVYDADTPPVGAQELGVKLDKKTGLIIDTGFLDQ